jgi:CRISPR system Cascade subunit CasE
MARPGAIRLLSSPYRMHAAVEQSFPPNSKRSSEEGRILWRVDSSPRREEGTWLYVVSPDYPDFSHIVEQGGWPANAESESKDYSPVLDCLESGQVWHFRLKGNPARKALVDKGKSPNQKVIGKIQGHVTAEQQLGWLLSRAGKHGFSIPNGKDGQPAVTASQRRVETYRHHGQTVTINTAVFDGVLVVKDAELLRHALCFGIGRAKGFGCGLLTIAPVS